MSLQRRRVLIIDSHAPSRAAARTVLEQRGFVVVAEADGAKAGLEAAQAVAADAVVLEIRLRDGNGIDVCRTLTQADPALAVLLVSVDAYHGWSATDCGAVGFMPKSRLASADLGGLLAGGANHDIVG
jgi:two-component system, NarL family, response regulator DevR